MSTVDNINQTDDVIISIFVDNHPGVLSRVALLFSQRAYNIESLTVAPTDRDDISRITVVTKDSKNKATVEQIVNQIKKLVEVKEVLLIDHDNEVSCDLALIRFNLDKVELEDVNTVVSNYNSRIMHISKSSIVVAIRGSKSHVDQCLEDAKKIGVCGVCRTGLASVEKHPTISID